MKYFLGTRQELAELRGSMVKLGLDPDIREAIGSVVVDGKPTAAVCLAIVVPDDIEARITAERGNLTREEADACDLAVARLAVRTHPSKAADEPTRLAAATEASTITPTRVALAVGGLAAAGYAAYELGRAAGVWP